MYLEIPICMGNSGGCIEVFVKNFDAVVSAFRNQILIESGCGKPHARSPPVRLTTSAMSVLFFSSSTHMPSISKDAPTHKKESQQD